MTARPKAQSEKFPVSLAFSVDRDALLAALKIAASASERSDSIPILANVLLDLSNDCLTITGTDMQTWAESSIPVTLMSLSGQTTLPAAVTLKIAGALEPGASVEISVCGDMATVKSGEFFCKLIALSAEDFPRAQGYDFSHKFEMDFVGLKTMINRTSFAISAEQTRYYLNGIYFHHSEGPAGPLLVMAATDGHRLAVCQHTAPNGASGMPGTIVPKRSVDILRAAFGECNVTVRLSSAPAIVFQSGDTRIIIKCIDGTFPEYGRAIPQENDKTCVIDTPALSRSMKRVSVISREKSFGLRLEFGGNRMVVSAHSSEYGSASHTLFSEYSGPAFHIGFNARYLRDIMARVGDRMRFAMTDQNAPVVITDPEDETTTYVLMPMRI